MWQKLSSIRIGQKILMGAIITDDPQDPLDQYHIISVHTGVVKGMHCNGKARVLKISKEEIAAGKWFYLDLV